jgi:uncharacterized protein DUF3828
VSVTSVRVLFLGLLLALTCPACVTAKDAPSARTFVEQLYASYTPDVAPKVLGADASKIFAAPLLALIREDQKRAQGEIGLLDHDPVCGCQDSGRMKTQSISVAEQSRSRARATVNLANAGETKKLDLDLTLENGRWRIADIADPDIPSLVQFLKNGLATAK